LREARPPRGPGGDGVTAPAQPHGRAGGSAPHRLPADWGHPATTIHLGTGKLRQGQKQAPPGSKGRRGGGPRRVSAARSVAGSRAPSAAGRLCSRGGVSSAFSSAAEPSRGDPKAEPGRVLFREGSGHLPSGRAGAARTKRLCSGRGAPAVPGAEAVPVAGPLAPTRWVSARGWGGGREPGAVPHPEVN